MERYASNKKVKNMSLQQANMVYFFLEKNLKTTDRECVYSILSQNYIFCICLGGGRDSSAATIIMHE